MYRNSANPVMLSFGRQMREFFPVCQDLSDQAIAVGHLEPAFLRVAAYCASPGSWRRAPGRGRLVLPPDVRTRVEDRVRISQPLQAYEIGIAPSLIRDEILAPFQHQPKLHPADSLTDLADRGLAVTPAPTTPSRPRPGRTPT
jgi:hypothetical protein